MIVAMDFGVITQNFDFLMKGLKFTLSLALISIVLSMFLGTVLGVIRHSKITFFSQLSTFFIEITRSIPLILFIIFIHFSFSPFLYENAVFSSILDMPSLEFQTACIAMTFFTSAYIAEIVRSGLLSIENEFIHAAKSLGLNYFQRLRYIVLPIAIKRMTPALISQFIALTKDTSLASAIGLIELTRSGEIVYERTHKEFEILIFIAIVYFLVCYSISLIGKKFESHKTCSS